MVNKTRTKSTFKPPWWLQSCHIQSALNILMPYQCQEVVQWEQLNLPDGDFIDLCWAGPTSGDIVILLHGLEGSIRSSYVQVMIDGLAAAGWQVVLMHFRTCSGRLNRLVRGYHAGDVADFAFLLSVLRQRYPHKRLRAVGFSLGGNVLLRYLGLYPTQTEVCQAVAVSVPFDLALCVDSLSTIYRWVLLAGLIDKVRAKIKLGYQMPVTINEVDQLNTFRLFDEFVTAPLHGFANADDYYLRASCRPVLNQITQPTLLIHADDDPLVPKVSIPSQRELSSAVTLEVHPNGGHIGFIGGRLFGRRQYWLSPRIIDFFTRR